MNRKTTRSTARSSVRPLSRGCLRGRRRGPDDLTQAFTAFGLAIRAHRRLARLAPRFFDSAVVDREAQNRAEQRRWMALWEPALAKAYGREPDPPDPDAGRPPLPPLPTQRAVDRQLAEQRFWMDAGRVAMERHQQRHPHALLNFRRLARLLNLATEFARLACGLDSKQPLPEKISYDYELTDLKRAYGQPNGTFGAGPDSVAPSSPTADVRSSTASSPPEEQGARPQERPAPAWPPPDDKRDLTPCRLIMGPPGFAFLQRIEEGDPS